MTLVFAAIAPHGGLAVAEACSPDEMQLARATRSGMEDLGRAFATAKPEAVIVATPHNVHISNSFGVVVAGRIAGNLGDDTPQRVALDVPGDTRLAWLVLETLAGENLPAVGVSYGSNDPAAAVAPMDWGVLIPLWFMGGREDPPLPLVVVTPARDLPADDHVLAGAAIAAAAAASGGRVAFIASADHGHAHRADGPYGYHSSAKVYDDLICRLVRADTLSGLRDIPLTLVEHAKADSWWQMLMLLGATGDGWHGRLISYEAPTYFGMLTAAYEPSSAGVPPTPAACRGRTSPRSGEVKLAAVPHHGLVHTLGPELERAYGDPLVGGVDGRRRVEVWRDVEGKEPVGADPKAREVARIGAAGDKRRHRHAPRIGLRQNGGEEVELRQVDLGLRRPDQRHLDLLLGSDHLAQLAEHVLGSITRQEAPVELHPHLAWDHVDLQPSAHDGRVYGVVQRCIQAAAQRTQLVERIVGSRGIEEGGDAALQRLVERVPNRLELVAGRGRDVQRQPAAIKLGGQLPELGHRASAGGDGTMAARSAQRDHHLAAALFRDHDRVEPPAAKMERNASRFADRVTDAGEKLRVRFDQPPRTGHATCLFVREHGQHEVTRRSAVSLGA